MAIREIERERETERQRERERDQKLRELEFEYSGRPSPAHVAQFHIHPSLWFIVEGPLCDSPVNGPLFSEVQGDLNNARLNEELKVDCFFEGEGPAGWLWGWGVGWKQYVTWVSGNDDLFITHCLLILQRKSKERERERGTENARETDVGC